MLINGSDLQFSVALRSHTEGQVTAVRLEDLDLESDLPIQFGFADGSFSERLPSGVLCPSQGGLGTPIAYVSLAQLDRSEEPGEGLLLVGERGENGDFEAALFSLERP